MSEKPPTQRARRGAPRCERDHDQHNSKGAIEDRGASSSGAANSTAFDPRETKRTSSATDARRESYERIHAKMQFLEEDTRVMKEAILGCVEDRAVLMSEISHKLHMIREHLSINSECKLDGSPRVCSFDPHKGGKKDIGLLGVLRQDQTPALVPRTKKINGGAFRN